MELDPSWSGEEISMACDSSHMEPDVFLVRSDTEVVLLCMMFSRDVVPSIVYQRSPGLRRRSVRLLYSLDTYPALLPHASCTHRTCGESCEEIFVFSNKTLVTHPKSLLVMPAKIVQLDHVATTIITCTRDILAHGGPDRVKFTFFSTTCFFWWETRRMHMRVVT